MENTGKDWTEAEDIRLFRAIDNRGYLTKKDVIEKLTLEFKRPYYGIQKRWTELQKKLVGKSSEKSVKMSKKSIQIQKFFNDNIGKTYATKELIKNFEKKGIAKDRLKYYLSRLANEDRIVRLKRGYYTSIFTKTEEPVIKYVRSKPDMAPEQIEKEIKEIGVETGYPTISKKPKEITIADRLFRILTQEQKDDLLKEFLGI